MTRGTAVPARAYGWHGEYAPVFVDWAGIHAGWPGFTVFALALHTLGWPGLEIFAHSVEYGGIRVTVRRAGAGVCVAGVCGVYLHRCRRCGFEGSADVHTAACPGCQYRAGGG